MLYSLPSSWRHVTRSHYVFAHKPWTNRIHIDSTAMHFVLPANDTDIFRRNLHPRVEMRPLKKIPNSQWKASMKIRIPYHHQYLEFFQVMHRSLPLLQLEQQDKQLQVRLVHLDNHLWRHPIRSFRRNEMLDIQLVWNKGKFQVTVNGKLEFSGDVSFKVNTDSTLWFQYGIYSSRKLSYDQHVEFLFLQVK